MNSSFVVRVLWSYDGFIPYFADLCNVKEFKVVWERAFSQTCDIEGKAQGEDFLYNQIQFLVFVNV